MESAEKLIVAISEQASQVNETSKPQETSSSLGWNSFDIRAVVSATEDLFQFILSKKGSRVQVFLIRDIFKAADTFLENEVVSCFSNEKIQVEKSESEGHKMLLRLVTVFQSLRNAVKLAPDAWTATGIRLALKPEFQRFAFDIVSALSSHSCRELPEALWLCMSRILHKSVKDGPPNFALFCYYLLLVSPAKPCIFGPK